MTPGPLTFNDACQDLLDYLGISLAEAKQRIDTCSDELKKDWLEQAPRSEEELRRYYGSVDGYLYGLTTFNFNPTYIAWREAMARHVQGLHRESVAVLDYGAGIGSNLLDLSRLPGVTCTHADVPGKNFDYAGWRYQRHGAAVDMVAIEDDDPLGDRQFDVILCIDVLEHLKDPEHAAQYLIDHLRPGGVLIATVWFVLEVDEDEGIIHLNTDKYTNASFWSCVDRMGVDAVEGDTQFRVYRKQERANLLWQAPLFDPSGYADEARNFLFGLEAIGSPVKACPVNASSQVAPLDDEMRDRLVAMTERELADDFVSLQHLFPPFFQRHPAAKRNIGRTMFETDRLPTDWVAKCNEMDEVWVPSDFNLETFARAGVQREKLFKLPGSLDPDRFTTEIEAMEVEGRRGFNFLSLFDWSLRKGWDVLLKAYVEEFDPDEDVALILKVYSSGGLTTDDIQAQIVDYLVNTLGRDPERIPDIVFVDAILTEEAMLRLYKASDAYVMPSRGEGWGRPLMEAMAMGLPTIGTGWSGNTEFMTPDNSYLIDYELVEVSPEACQEAPNVHGHRWAEPSVAHLRQLMRQIFTHRDEARATGAIARHDVLTRLDRRVVARQIEHRLSSPPEPPLRGIWEGGQFVYHSLAYVNRELELALLDTGEVELSLMPLGKPQFDESADPRFGRLQQRFGRALSGPADFHLRHQFPPNFEPPPEGHWIMIQPWEFGGIPEAWRHPMHHAVDEIWVPSHFVRDCYLHSGIAPDRVHVVPNGVDTHLFSPEGPQALLPTRKAFKFLYVGGTILRKGLDILLTAYLDAFTAEDDVCLVIKDFCTDSVYAESNMLETIRESQERPNAPKILYLNEDLPGEELAALYRACDALVHPYRGEGFGLPIAEAMACGLPVIVPNYGACLDFCDSETALLVPAEIVPLRELKDIPPTRAGYWVSEVQNEDLIKAMRSAWQTPERGREIGRKASERIRREFTWPRAAEVALERLRCLQKKPIVRHQPDYADPRLFHPDVAPFALEGLKGFNFLICPDWERLDWVADLQAYLEAFSVGEDVSLVLRIDPNGTVTSEQAQARLMEALARFGRDPEEIPDLLLVDAPLPLGGEATFFTACQAFITRPDGLYNRKADACGLALLEAPGPEELRVAASRAGRSPIGAPR